MISKRQVRLSKCSVSTEEKQAVARVLDNAYLGMGKEVQAFELELKNYLNTESEVICVNTGTAALHLAIECLDLPLGSEVLVPSVTYVASFQAITASGLVPVACDINSETYFIDLQDAGQRLTSKTKAIMPVHYGSFSGSMPAVYEFAKNHGLRVVEDAAQAFGCSRDHKKVGSVGDVICISFDGIKNITCGEGGCVITGDKKLAQRIKDARLLGVEKDTEKRYSGQRSWVFDVQHQGYRYHMSDIMASIGRAQLLKIDSFSDKRKSLVQIYLKELSGLKSLSLLKYDYENIVPHIFVVKITNGSRDKAVDNLSQHGIATGMHYYPNHLLSKFKTSYSLPRAELALEQMLTLPLHVDLSAEDVLYVCETLKAYLD